MDLRGHRLSFRTPSWVSQAFGVCLCFTLAMTAVAMFTGQWITKTHFYYSYELQAQAWLNGTLYIPDGEDYSWLELAIYDGQYYVSFPPFPSYVLLPFVALGGVSLPDGILAWVCAMLSCVYAVRLCVTMTGSSRQVPLLALFLLLGNGYLYLTMNSWVWFIAQNMCFALCVMSLYYALVGKGGQSLGFWACAVGCRPMSVLWFPVLAYLIVRHHRLREPALNFFRLAVKKWYWAIAPVLLAASYMTLNYLRFGSVLEFGHNYLPEFTRTTTGQFNISYLWSNILQYLTPPAWQGNDTALGFGAIDGSAFWLLNPLLVLTPVAWISALRHREEQDCFLLLLLPVLLLAYFLLICLHRTLGGVQFGNRYLVDLMPFAFFGLLMWQPKSGTFRRILTALAVYGISVNLIGTVLSYNNLL